LQIDAEAAWKTWCRPSGQVSYVLFAHQLMNVFVVTRRIITAEMAFPDSHEESYGKSYVIGWRLIRACDQDPALDFLYQIHYL
jgi:hypothetical protein